MNHTDRLARARAIVAELAKRKRERPLDYVRWLVGQDAFLRCEAKRKCFRSGNQYTGKTWAGCAETWWRLTRQHPYRPDLNAKPPPTIIIVGATWPQANTIQHKMWQLCERSQLVDGCEYDPAKGAFRGKYPTLRLRNGAVAHFTAAAGEVLSIAGKTVDAVWIDEPISDPRLYTELGRRVARANGDVYMTFTPVNAKVEWLKEECEAGRIVDLHYPITAENLRFADTGEPITLDDGTVCDAEWLAREIASLPAYEVPVIIGGEWEFRSTGALWKHYRDSGPDSHVVTRSSVETAAEDWRVCLGIDHGDREFAACASLVLVAGDAVEPRVVVLDEWHSDGSTTIREDAQGILAMVKRNLTGGWADLNAVFGDVPHAGTKRSAGRKSNHALTQALRQELGLSATRQPLPVPIRPVRKPPGSVNWGHRFVHNALLQHGAFAVVEGCERTRHCLLTFDGRPNTPESHQIDAMRYALTEQIERGGWRATEGPTVHIY